MVPKKGPPSCCSSSGELGSEDGTQESFRELEGRGVVPAFLVDHQAGGGEAPGTEGMPMGCV